ncbi:MAG: hypothetical protein AB2A00_24255 [Myxococcota bacterium]
MAHPFDNVLATAVLPQQRDERAAEVIETTGPEPEPRQVNVPRLVHNGSVARLLGIPTTRNHQIVRLRLAPGQLHKAVRAPMLQEDRKRRVDGHRARLFRLHRLESFLLGVERGGHRDAPQRRHGCVNGAPAQAGHLTRRAQPSEGADGVEDPALLSNPRVRNDLLNFLAGQNRGGPPLRVLVDLLWQVTTTEHAGVDLDQLVDKRVLEHRVQQPVDMPHAARRQRLCSGELVNQIPNVADLHVVKMHRANDGQRVLLKPCLVVVHGPHPAGAPRFDPQLGVLRHRQLGACLLLGPSGRAQPGFNLLQDGARLRLFSDVEARGLLVALTVEVVADPQLVTALEDVPHDVTFLPRCAQQCPPRAQLLLAPPRPSVRPAHCA